MSEVKRYEPVIDVKINNSEFATMEEDNYGDYIIHSDYTIAIDKGVDILGYEIKKLKAQLEKCEVALEFYADSDNWEYKSPVQADYVVILDDSGTGEFQLNHMTDDDRVGGRQSPRILQRKGAGVSELVKFKLGAEDTHNAYDAPNARYTFVISGRWLVNFRGQKYQDFFRAGDTLSGGDLIEAHLIEKRESGYTLTKDGLNESPKKKKEQV